MSRTITLQIDGMHCTNCAMTLEGIEDHLPGILRAEASYRHARLVVEFDESKVDEARIEKEVERLGYKVSAINR